MSQSTIEVAWDGAPNTIVLLYALHSQLGGLWEVANKMNLISSLQSAVRNPISIKRALSLYEFIMRQLDTRADVIAFRRWRVINIADTDVIPLPEFDESQRERALSIVGPKAHRGSKGLPLQR